MSKTLDEFYDLISADAFRALESYNATTVFEQAAPAARRYAPLPKTKRQGNEE